MAFTDDLPGPSRAGQPDYRCEVTAEPAEPIMRQPGVPLPPDAVVTGPEIARLHPDPDVARGPGPQCRDSAGIMDADQTAQALGRRREQVEAAVREQAAREAQLGERARHETARQAAAGGPELARTGLDAEIDRLAEAYPEPAEHTANGWYSAPAQQIAALGDETGVDAARWVPGQERDELEVAGELLSRHAVEAEDAFRRERHATAYERFAQRVHDEQLLGLARDVARNARADRRAATKDAYLAAARLQRSALGPEPQDTGRLPQHPADHIGWPPGVTSPAAEHQLEAG
jgi:hypothetical protein